MGTRPLECRVSSAHVMRSSKSGRTMLMPWFNDLDSDLGGNLAQKLVNYNLALWLPTIFSNGQACSWVWMHSYILLLFCKICFPKAYLFPPALSRQVGGSSEATPPCPATHTRSKWCLLGDKKWLHSEDFNNNLKILTIIIIMWDIIIQLGFLNAIPFRAKWRMAEKRPSIWRLEYLLGNYSQWIFFED